MANRKHTVPYTVLQALDMTNISGAMRQSYSSLLLIWEFKGPVELSFNLWFWINILSLSTALEGHSFSRTLQLPFFLNEPLHFDLVQFCSWQFTGQVKVQMYSFCASAVQWSYTPSPPTSSLSQSNCCSTFIVSIPTPLGFRNRCLNIYLLYIPLETWVFWRCNRRATQPHQRTSIKGHSGVWMDGALESDPGSQRSTMALITSPLIRCISNACPCDLNEPGDIVYCRALLILLYYLEEEDQVPALLGCLVHAHEHPAASKICDHDRFKVIWGEPDLHSCVFFWLSPYSRDKSLPNLYSEPQVYS